MYNQVIVENFSNPKHVGSLVGADFEIEIGNPVCGDRIRVQLKANQHTVEEAVFKAWGCATSVATANIFCNSITGKELSHISQRNTSEFQSMLGDLEPSQQHCLSILEQLHSQLVSAWPKENIAK